jgi:hypothetical protein
MSRRILVVTAQGEVRYLGSESEAVRVLTIQPTGARGAAGVGVPTGGSANDILKKTDSTDYVTEWETPTSAATSEAIVRRDETGGAFFGGDVGAPKFRGWFYQAESATDGASLRNSSGTEILTWGATAGNISITVNTTSTGHFFSNPSTAEAGHFLTKNGTTPTLAAGRSAWYSSATGAPRFKNGTGGSVTLIYSGGALGTPSSGTLTNCTGLPVSTGISGLGAGIATFLATPSSANLIAAVTDETGDGDIVTNANPTIYDIYLEDSVNFNATSYTYGAESAALHRTALGLTALATTTPGTGVATLLTGTSSGTGGPAGTINPTLTGYTEATVAIGNSGTSQTLSLVNGTFQTVTMTGNCTFTMPTATAGQSFILKVLTGAGGFTGTFTSVKWSGGTAPTLTATASKYDLISFVADGSAWSGSIIQNYTV